MLPSRLPNPVAAGYSQISVVEPGRLAFVSGQVAWTGDGAPPPATLGGQAALAVRNAHAAPAAVGATSGDLVTARVYLVDLTEMRMGEMMPRLHILFDDGSRR